MMRLELTKQECNWLADLASKAKYNAERANEETPNPIFELRRDNMASLELKLNEALHRQVIRERKDVR